MSGFVPLSDCWLEKEDSFREAQRKTEHYIREGEQSEAAVRSSMDDSEKRKLLFFFLNSVFIDDGHRFK